MGLAKSPNGYVSRRSVLTVKGSLAMSVSEAMEAGVSPRSSMRERNSGTCSYERATTDWSRCSCTASS